MSSPITIYTDGACKGNPGPGGWAAVLSYGEHLREISGTEALTTNNRMEMTAVIHALQTLRKKYPVHLFTDSKYVSQGIQEWLPNWRRRGFRKSDGKPVKNADLWRQLDALAQQYPIEWFWVRGHAGNDGNERANELAQQAAATAQTQITT